MTATRRLLAALTLAGLLLTSSTALAGEGDGKPPPEEPKGKCIDVRAEARYSGYGYDHIVHVDNHCDKAQRCEVSTNVNPTVQRVTVAAGKTASVVTFRGSPARTFEPKVDCKPAD